MDLYLLRRHLGIEPEEAHDQRPAWVIDLLSEGLRLELGGRDDEPRPARTGRVPAALKELPLMDGDA